MKSGQKYRPEHYDAATIMMTDIVQFTALASESTPLQVCHILTSKTIYQVVALLNELYSIFDSRIAEFDIYKVFLYIEKSFFDD